jgi:transcriptional regulator with XRE-family HTH domain
MERFEDFCLFLRKNRIKKNKFASDIGYNYSHIIQILNGKIKPTQRIIKAIEAYRERIEKDNEIREIKEIKDKI